MSRLNATIKLVVFLGETFFLLVSIFCTIASSIVYSGKILSLDFSSARQTAFKVLLLSCTVLFCTVIGCCGVANQLVRRGHCHGRRILCLHQFLLITVLVSSISQASTLRKREMSLKLVMTNVTNYPTYDSFEDRLNIYFNHAYFDWICNPTFSWAGDWIDGNCPISMASQTCEPVTKKGETGNYCDTFCPTSWNEQDCCPSQELCSNERKDNCPYHRCRVEVLRKVYHMLNPLLLLLRFISFLASTLIILTCLLVCYNPRDEIEVELLKTGVMTDEDIETIRRLKSEHKFSYQQGKRQSINLDSIHDLSVRTSGASTAYQSSRSFGRRSSRVHPSFA